MMASKGNKAALINEVLRLPAEYEDYTYDDAIRLVKAAIETKDAPFLHFILACFYSAINRITESLSELEHALQGGYNNWDAIFSDPSLANARFTKGFKEILSKYYKP